MTFVDRPMPGVIVDPQGQTVSVSITASPSGATPTVYKDQGGANTWTMPATISSPTRFFLPNPGSYTVNGQIVTIEGSEVATVTLQSGAYVGTSPTQTGPLSGGAAGQTFVDSKGESWVCLSSGVWRPAGSVPAANMRPSLLAKWRAALGNTATSPARILCVGDSTTRGVGSGVDGLSGWPNYLSKKLNARGLSAADGLVLPEYDRGTQTADTRLAYGSGWSVTTVGSNLFWGGVGAFWFGTAGGAGTLVFSPGTTCDTFDIYYETASNTGSFTATPTGASGTVINTNGGLGLGKTTVNAAALSNTNTLTLSAPTGNNVVIVGVEAYNRTSPQILVGNAGISTSYAANQVSTNNQTWSNEAQTPVGPLDCIKKYAPNLSIIDLAGINDIAVGASLAAFETGIQAVIAACQASGDVILMTETPTYTGYDTGGLQPQIVSYLQGLGLPIIDTYNRWGGQPNYSTAFGENYYFAASNNHPSTLGYNDKAEAVVAALTVL